MKSNQITNLTGKFSKGVRLATASEIRMRSEESLKFFREYSYKQLQSINTIQALTETQETQIVNSKRGISPGDIVCFNYSPLYAKKIPYYDKTPLLLPIGFTSQGFNGLNLHYLKPADRAKLLDIIYKQDKNIMGYMHALAQTPYYKPAFKQYLYSRMRSKVHIFDRQHWDMAIYLPLARFVKNTQQHASSKAITRKK